MFHIRERKIISDAESKSLKEIRSIIILNISIFIRDLRDSDIAAFIRSLYLLIKRTFVV